MKDNNFEQKGQCVQEDGDRTRDTGGVWQEGSEIKHQHSQNCCVEPRFKLSHMEESRGNNLGL